MVTSQTLLDAQQLKKKRIQIFSICLVLGLAATIFCMVMRWPIPMYALGVLWIIGCIAGAGLWVSPAVHYANFQRDIHNGRKQSVEAIFEGAAPNPSVRSHIDVLEMRFKDSNVQGDPRQAQSRVVYWDMQYPPPQLELGQVVNLTTYEYWIVDIQPVKTETQLE